MDNVSPDDATVAFDGPRPEIDIPGYKVLRHLGQGGMGSVYLAEDAALGRKVAIKVVAEGIARDPEVRARFLREARLLATVEHPNVVRVYSFAATAERAYLVMEYVEGETLADRIRRGPLSVAEAREIVATIAGALEAAWEKRIVHRDIKPSNILFDSRGILKVADFGLAKGTEGKDTESSLTQSGYLLGSPHYVAPEQAQGAESDFRADIYSLGVTLFEMLTGRKPFEGNSALAIISKHLHDELPALKGNELGSLVARMTRKDPRERPASYAELREMLGGRTLPAPTASRAHAVRPYRVAALVCAVAAAILFIFFATRTAPPVAKNDDRLVVAVAPFWGPDDESAKEGHSMAALVQQQIVTRLGGAAKVLGIDETKTAVRDADSARALGERLGATAVIWGQAFAMHNEREIQPSLTLVPRAQPRIANYQTAIASLAERRNVGGDLPATPEAVRVQAGSANQLDMRKTSAEGIGDLVTFLAVMHALRQDEPQRALELLAQTRKTPDALYQKAVCLAAMRRDDDAARELNEALKIDPMHAPSLAMLADIDARAFHYVDAAERLRAAAATGRRFTTSEAALYGGKLYAMERYRETGELHDTATMIAVDTTVDRIVDRWELPGPPRVFSVDDAGLTVKVDIGPPRDGELMTLHFVKDNFVGPPLPHVNMIGRIRRMKLGWMIPSNFSQELHFPGLKLPAAHFRYSNYDAAQPKTLPDLKTALERAIARDPKDPWHRMYLAVTLWELGDRAGANAAFDAALAEASPRVPYYEFAWMPRLLEPLGHHDWADRAYAEALKRRGAEPLPIAGCATVERLLVAPFARRASFHAITAPDPARDRLWLARARELTGLTWDGDAIASAEWARWFRQHGDAAAAQQEERAHAEAEAAFGGLRLALTMQDLTRAAQIAVVIALAVLLLLVLRAGGFGALSPQERTAFVLLAALLVIAAGARLAAASRARLAELVPVPASENLSHPVIVASLDQALAEHDSDDLRFITAVAHQLAGDARGAAQLYRTLSWKIATDNATYDRPENLPTPEMYVRAFHRLSPSALRHTLRAGWGPRPQEDHPLSVAEYEGSQVFYVSLILAAALLLLVAGAGRGARATPAVAIAVFVAGALFAGIAFRAHAAAEDAMSGKYSAMFRESLTSVYPLPPDPAVDATVPTSLKHDDKVQEIANARARAALGRSNAMRMFWMALAAGVLAASAGGVYAFRATKIARGEPRTNASLATEA